LEARTRNSQKATQLFYLLGNLIPIKAARNIATSLFTGKPFLRVSLLFVGAGALENELRTQAANHPHIYFAPFQNQTLMPRTYAAADLLVLPSYSETWGLVINEAMCMSRAVIASTHVGCAQDLIHPYRNGLIFPAGDVSALTTCLKEAFSDRKRLQIWGEESRQIIASYSYKQTTEGLKQALNHLRIL
jgi:glycosyltransferase involved in cell wall biosynthesis